GKLPASVGGPVSGDAFGEERRPFALSLVDEGEVERRRLVSPAMPQRGLRLARVMVAVVVKEDNFTADLGLEPPGGHKFGMEEPTREETAGLLAEANDG